MKIKYTVSEVKKSSELNNADIMYTRRIIFFMIKVTKQNVIDALFQANILTDQIKQIIKDA